MTLEELLLLLKDKPETVEFGDSVSVIEQHYHFTPTAFDNGDTYNAAGDNNGSCKLLAFAQLQGLNEAQALALFGRYYREDVLSHPNGSDHQNIRNFLRSGWSGVRFHGQPLTPIAD